MRWGDTLSGIAARHRVSLSSLLKANGMTVSSLIFPGTKLAVPGGSGSSGSTPAPSGASSSPAAASGSSGSSHAVRAGDTLSGIASKYGVSLGSLLTVNSMSVTSLIVPGMRLALPGGASSAGGPSRSSAPSPASSGVAAVVDYALAQVGKPYRFFAKGPDAFDCSGLTLAAYQQIGIDLIHYSAYQAKRGAAVDFRNESIRPGDLVFQALSWQRDDQPCRHCDHLDDLGAGRRHRFDREARPDAVDRIHHRSAADGRQLSHETARIEQDADEDR